MGLRLAFLFHPLALDEAGTYIQYASQPLNIGLSYYFQPNNHLLNTFFVHLSTRVFGSAEWAIRLPALVFGLLVIPATFLVVRRLLGRYPALFASAFVAFAPMMVIYSTNARGYSLQTLILLLLVWFALEMKENGARAANLIPFSVLSGLGFYTIPTMLYFWPGLVLWLLLSALAGDVEGEAKRFFGLLCAGCAASAALTFLLYLPVIRRMGLEALVGNEWVRAASWTSFAGNFFGTTLKGLWISWTESMPPVISVILATGFLLSVVFYKKLCPHRVNLPLSILLPALALVLIMRSVVWFPRIWLPFFPLFAGFSIAGLQYAGIRVGRFMRERERTPRRLPGCLPELLVLILFAVFSLTALVNPAAFKVEDVGTKTVVETVIPYLRDGDLVCVDEWTAPLYQYYFERLGIPIRQFAPNQRIVPENAEDQGEPRRYVLVYESDDEQRQLLAQETAVKRGLRPDPVTIGYLDVAGHDVFFLENR